MNEILINNNDNEMLSNYNNSMDENHDLNIDSSFQNEIYINQKNFLETNLGKVINTAIDIGLKALLPNLIENEIIDIKNTILEQGFSEGIKDVINSGIDMGKSISGIVTGNFENISQVQMAIKKGGVLDKISGLLDYSINIANKKNLIDNKTSILIKNGKNTIINSIGEKIEENLTNQIKSIEKLESYCEKWNQSFENKDIKSMNSAYKNIQKYINKTLPIENILKEARKIENLHNLIKNSDNNFDITDEQKLLAEKLT